jgi:hypothetical protein
MSSIYQAKSQKSHVVEQPKFTAKQLAYLEATFPEPTGSHQSDAEVRYAMGQRSVIKFISTKIQHTGEV